MHEVRKLRNMSSTQWVCDPHIQVHFGSCLLHKSLTIPHQVPFQPNHFDCGIHTLWHLQHVLKFRCVQGVDCSLNHLRFTENMVGKRLWLAQEILEDCGLWELVYNSCEFNRLLCCVRRAKDAINDSHISSHKQGGNNYLIQPHFPL